MDDDHPRDESPLKIDSGLGVTRLTLRKPPVNVFDGPLIEALSKALAQAEANPCKALVVSSEYERVFSAGVSIEDHLPDSLEAMLLQFHGLCRRVFELSPVTIALVRGDCLGGAMEFVSCFDFVVAESGSRFGQPEISLACFAPWAASWYPRLFGAKTANAFLLEGKPMGPEKARRLGFIERIAPQGQGPDAVESLVDEILAKSVPALALSKKALRRASHPFETLDSIETIYREELARSEDMTEGLRAFLEKRPPRWKDR